MRARDVRSKPFPQRQRGRDRSSAHAACTSRLLWSAAFTRYVVCPEIRSLRGQTRRPPCTTGGGRAISGFLTGTSGHGGNHFCFVFFCDCLMMSLTNRMLFCLMCCQGLQIHVGSVDSGLHFGLLLPTGTEWNSTFPGHAHGVVYVWSKCYLDEMRSFYWIDTGLPEHSFSARFTQARSVAQQLKFLINGLPPKRVDVAQDTRGGGEFLAALNSAQALHETVRIGVKGWRRTFDFPLALCASPPEVRSGLRTRIMNIHTQWEVGDDTQNLVSMISKHARASACTLNTSRYEIVLATPLIDHLMKDAYLRAAIEAKTVVALSKVLIPAPIKGYGVFYQTIYQNLAILSHWKENAVIFLFDPDEFVIFSDHSLAGMKRFNNALENHAVLSFLRPSVVCVDCDGKSVGELDDISDPFTKHLWSFTTSPNWNTGFKHGGMWAHAPKVGVYADDAIGAACHFASTRVGSEVDMSTLGVFIAHLVNALHTRETDNITSSLTTEQISDMSCTP